MCTAFLASRASATPLLNPKTPLQLGQAVWSSIMKWDLNNCLVFFRSFRRYHSAYLLSCMSNPF